MIEPIKPEYWTDAWLDGWRAADADDLDCEYDPNAFPDADLSDVDVESWRAGYEAYWDSRQ